ncbi:acyltransferase domain-containing protein [Kitasatospora camelliae]|uniref:Acyltransferase domain-containing protein n=1 Tax=Kitasatospora camelliae TaxID=3156397 RepID=A0AAU8K3Q1_9ACTN
MSLTAHTAVTRRLTVETGSGPSRRTAAEVPGPLLDALGHHRPERLPARTVLYVGGFPAPTRPSADHRGLPVRTEPTPGRALRLAHRELQAKTADLALVATLDEPETGAVTVQVLRRAAEAVAEGGPVIGVLDLADVSGESGLSGLSRLSGESGLSGDEEQAPVVRPLRNGVRAADTEGHRLLIWSGADEPDETRVRRDLLSLLDDLAPEAFAGLPTAVPYGRAFGPVRASAVTTAHRAPADVAAAKAVTTRHQRPVALLFPGQGSQHTAMAAGLYRRDPVFTAAVDAVLDLMGEDGPAIRADWLSDRPVIDIDDVRRAQPLLFAVDYALGRTVLSWGVRPVALLGHSAGELVAATLAGVVSLPDAVTMMRERVTEAVKIPAGGMLAVAAAERTLRPYLAGDVAIAAVNAGQQTMLAGSTGPLGEVASRLRADGHTVVAVPATSPFHSPAMAPASDALELSYRGLDLREPELPFYSGYTGELMGREEALSPRYWARQVTDTVNFAPALDQLLAADDVLLVEAGPRQTLTAFARRHRAVRVGASAAVPLLPAKPGTPEDDRRAVLTAAARIWSEGHDLDQEALSRLWTWRQEPAGTDVARPVVAGATAAG